MKRLACVVSCAVVVSLLVAICQPEFAVAQSPPIATAISVQGTVEAQRAGQTAWQPVKLNDTFAAGDTIRVQERSRADLSMLDQSVMRLNANTQLTLQPVKDERTGVVNMLRGAAHFLSRGPRSLDVQTPSTVAGVRGTEFLVTVEPDQTLLTIFEGTVVAQSKDGSLTLTSGQSAVAETGKAPVLRVVARPRDAVHWALHYPPVLYFRPDEFPAGTDWQGMTRQSHDHYLRGDIARAFDAIATVPPTVTDPRFFAYRSHLLLGVGRVDEAAADIERALKLAPNDANALALQTIIAVVQGERDRALEIAQRAVQAAPDSATALIALSYAQQAHLDLEGARTSLQTAVQRDPRNALAWARLSELWASFGELGEALKAAEQAVALEPNLSRTQTVLGYAYLMQVKVKQAMAAFEKAIALDSADPLPRMGLGLAKIRQSDLHAGGRDLEAAASLDPNNAIVRSYLGKTYYEEKRTGLDEREYSIAKQLDPNDPTPWFYDAITKQTTNRPVEALHSLERAIELNDNRAVYRSSLLLDADLAARSASLGRIYGDLGFQQLALVEGWKSVNTDPTNFSAHRLLADSYAILPRHEIARVSELLQSQLLQPLNVTPIQPRLAESNLFLIGAGGPGALSFNEFNPIFNRDGVTVLATGLGGSHNTWAGEGVVSGIYRNLSLSVGYTHFSTDGWRRNADQKEDIANAFVQFALTPRTSLQFEYRYREAERGDLQLKFFEESVFPAQRFTSEAHTFRVGARHSFSPSSTLLASFMYQDSSFRERHEPFPQPGVLLVDFNQPDQKAFGGELQHLFRSRYFNLVTGGGYFDVNDRLDQLITFGVPFIPGPPFTPPTIDIEGVTDLDLRHANVYGYSYINVLRDVTFTLGLSYDHADSEFLDEVRRQLNPKLGVVWTPLPGTSIRAAAFRSLKRTLITQQTLEPTQVAGFNQFFDDGDLTESRRYGVAIDQKFTKSVYAGIEASKRDLKVPFLDFTVDPQSPPTRRSDWDEYLGRAYVFWALHDWWALRAEYAFERLKRAEPFIEGVTEADTHQVPLGVSFFHPSGFSAHVTATYFNQSGEFGGFFATDPIRKGSDQFWTADVAVNYRLPKRYGFVTLGVTNLFNQDFRFYDPDLNNARIQPTRMVFGRVTLAWP